MDKEFNLVQTGDPHIDRKKQILSQYPEIQALCQPNPWSLLLIVCLVMAQLSLAYFSRELPLWTIALFSYVVGACFAASLTALIHESSHNLIFHKKSHNRLSGIVANIPLVLVNSETFKRYHTAHHNLMGDYQMDVGIPTFKEASWVGNSSFKKFLWLTFFSYVQLLRTKKYISRKPFWDRWMVTNFLVQGVTLLLLSMSVGVSGLLYLLLSLFFAFGFHPLGARVIQEHVQMDKHQETNNYTGIANLFECNFGYHNEHHDFPKAPWNKLPAISKMAPEFYSSLHHHPSRWCLIKDFILNPEWTLFRHAVKNVTKSI